MQKIISQFYKVTNQALLKISQNTLGYISLSCAFCVAETVFTWQLHQVPHSLPRYDEEWGDFLFLTYFPPFK